MRLSILLLCSALAIPGVASTQSADDVVIMRRSVAPPARDAAATPQWRYGEWTFQTSDACTPDASETRTATCTLRGQTVAASACRTPPEQTARDAVRTDGCSAVGWKSTPNAPFNAQCTQARDVPMTVACSGTKPDGSTVWLPDDRCSGAKPALSLSTPAVTSGCASVGWTVGVRGEWTPSECSASATYPVASECRAHAVAGDAGFVVDDTICDPNLKPKSPAPTIVTASCSSIAWVISSTGAWSSTCSSTATRSQTSTCRATAPGGAFFTVPNTACSAGSRPPAVSAPEPRYEGCAARWSVTQYANDSGKAECSESVPESRQVTCVATVNGVTNTVIPNEVCESLGAGAGTKQTVLTTRSSDWSACDGTWVEGATYSYGTCSSGYRSKTRNDVCKNPTTGQVYSPAEGHCNMTNAVHPNSGNYTSQVGCLGTCSSTFQSNYSVTSTSPTFSEATAGYVGTLTETAKNQAAIAYCEEAKIKSSYKYLVGCVLSGDFVYPYLSNSYSITFANPQGNATLGTRSGYSLVMCTPYS